MSIHIPLYHEVLTQLSHFLVEQGTLGVLLIDISELQNIKKWHGKNTCLAVEKFVIQLINEMKGDLIRRDDLLTQNYPDKDEFLVFLSYKRTGRRFFFSDIELLAKRINKHLTEELTRQYGCDLGNPKIYLGYAVVIQNTLFTPEIIISRLIKDAKKMAECHIFKSRAENRANIHELILKEKIKTVYQPICNINTFEVIGYEALARGPMGTRYEYPHALFEVADDSNLIIELDRLCRKHTFGNIQDSSSSTSFFINCIPRYLNEHEFRIRYLDEIIDEIRQGAGNIVLELTEEEAIENYDLLQEALVYYSCLGLAVKIDNRGGGFSSLETICSLRPEYIKLDISMVKDIHSQPIKQYMISALSKISKIMNACLICEGVETEKEHEKLKQIGVSFGQGFFYARPDYPFPEIRGGKHEEPETKS